MATMEQRRDRLVTRQVEARGVRDPLVLAAMKAVRRELFVPKDLTAPKLTTIRLFPSAPARRSRSPILLRS